MLDSLTLSQISTFVAVADSGSFRAGAKRLSRVQSAVSHAVANLEVELGVLLFDRTGQRPRLTSEGRALLADARAILLKVDVMRARAGGMGGGVELEFAIEIDPLFPLSIAAAALNEVRTAYPSVGVRMSLSALSGPIVALDQGRCQMAIVMSDNFPMPHVELEALQSVSFVAVVGSNHPLATRSADGDLVSTFELADHLQIVLEDATPLSEGRQFGVLSPGVWRVNNQEAKHALIVSGLGWGRLPMWLVERDLIEGRLVRLATPALGRQGEAILQAYIARRSDVPLGPAARLFRDFLIGEVSRSTVELAR